MFQQRAVMLSNDASDAEYPHPQGCWGDKSLMDVCCGIMLHHFADSYPAADAADAETADADAAGPKRRQRQHMIND